MVLIELLLPTSGAAGVDGLAPLAETWRELAERFNGPETDLFERADMLDTKVGQGKRTTPRMWHVWASMP